MGGFWAAVDFGAGFLAAAADLDFGAADLAVDGLAADFFCGLLGLGEAEAADGFADFGAAAFLGLGAAVLLCGVFFVWVAVVAMDPPLVLMSHLRKLCHYYTPDLLCFQTQAG